MGKYCYVILKNNYNQTKENIIDYGVRGEYSPTISWLNGVKGTTAYVSVKNVWGTYKQKEKFIYDKFPIICEDRGNMFIDIITEKQFKKAPSETTTSWTYPQIIVKKVMEISPTEAAQKIRSLNQTELQNYQSKMNELERNVVKTYNEYVGLQKIKRQDEIDSENFLNEFRRRKK